MNTKSNSAENKRAEEERDPEGITNPQLKKFFEDALKDIYWSEKALAKALPRLQKATKTKELQSAIEYHVQQTLDHIMRLEQVFQLIGNKAQAKKCHAMEGLISESQSIVEETENGSLSRDAGIIIAAQKFEHYEIATYGGLISLANTLGFAEAAHLLTSIIEEEKETDSRLTEIAEDILSWAGEEEDEDIIRHEENAIEEKTKILSVEDIYLHGQKVFEDVEKFGHWLHQPNKALANQVPYDLLENKESRIQVDDLIGRIEYGVYS